MCGCTSTQQGSTLLEEHEPQNRRRTSLAIPASNETPTLCPPLKSALIQPKLSKATVLTTSSPFGTDQSQTPITTTGWSTPTAQTTTRTDQSQTPITTTSRSTPPREQPFPLTNHTLPTTTTGLFHPTAKTAHPGTRKKTQEKYKTIKKKTIRERE